MKITEERGEINTLALSWIVFGVVFVMTASFATWAFLSRQDYKNNSDKKVAAAVDVAQKNTAAQKDNEYLEKEKYPLKSYQASDDLGSLSVSYPKTWSAYIATGNQNQFIFNPDFVNADTQSLYALKITVDQTGYKDVLSQYESQVQQGLATAQAYSLPKVRSVVGVRFQGQIKPGQPGALVVLPLRDKTIEIACQVPDRLKDFDNIILKNLSYNP